MKRLALLLLALLLLSSLAPLASAGEAWMKEAGSAITAVATDERGDLIFVGTESGMVYCYNAAGSVVWSRQISVTGINPPVLDIRADTEGHIWIRTNIGYLLLDAATGNIKWSHYNPTISSPGGDISNTGIALNVWSTLFDLKIPAGHTIFRSSGPYNIGAISGDGTWAVATKQADPNLYLYSVNVPPDDWIAPLNGYGWQNRVSHTITGSPDGTLTDYPVEIQVIQGTGTSTGSTLYAPECRADFADIRFTAADGVTQIPYYLESVVGNTATFLVNVPSIPASPGTTTIYIYWDNCAVTTTTSDPNAVYTIYDDFNDGVIGPQWSVYKDPDGIVQETGGYLELKSPYSATGHKGAYVHSARLTGAAHIEVSVKILSTYDSKNNNRHRIFECDGDPGIFNDLSHTVLQRHWGGYSGAAATLNTFVKHDIYITPGESTRWVAGSDWDVLSTEYVNNGSRLTFKTGELGLKNAYGHMQIDYARISKWTPNEPTHGAWGSVETTVKPIGTKTLDGTIIDIDAPETGDWVAVSTTTKTYIIQITDSGFGTTYSADRTGTPYQIQVADGGSFAIEGRNILADIFRIDAVQVGTYTAGGAVQHVAIAQKNGLYAAAGSDDGKYYVFSKDAASSWYLLHASDSYDPVTALAMSWRGELLIVGRADGRLSAFQVSEQEAAGSIRVTIFKDNVPYTNATLCIEDGGADQEWSAPISVTTDDYGVAAVPVQWGNYLRITIGDDELSRIIVANPTQTEYVLRIKGPTPLRTGAQYASSYDPNTQRIYLSYDDTREKTHRVVYQIVRAADNAVVFEREYTDADLPLSDYYQIPAGWTNTSYRVHLTASGSPSFTNTWNQWVGTDGVATLPGELDKFAKMGIAFFLILFVAGLFSYYTGPQGAVVVSLFTAALVLWGWLPLPPAVVALAIIWAFLGLLGRTSGEG